MALTGVTNKKFYSVMLAWGMYVTLQKDEYYKIVKMVPGVATTIDPDPALVEKKLVFSMTKNIDVRMGELEEYIPSDGYDSMGLTYDRIAKHLVNNPDSVIYYEDEVEIDPEVALDLSSPELYADVTVWDFLNSFPLASLVNVKSTWKEIGVKFMWPVLTAQTITDITALLVDVNAVFDNAESAFAAKEAAEKRFKEKATQIINNQ